MSRKKKKKRKGEIRMKGEVVVIQCTREALENLERELVSIVKFIDLLGVQNKITLNDFTNLKVIKLNMQQALEEFVEMHPEISDRLRQERIIL